MKHIREMLLVAALLPVTLLQAQEEVKPLRFNFRAGDGAAVSLRQSVALPFSDDFSYLSAVPDPTLWVDRQAFINTSFPVNPVSYGVATLDGLKENGQPYDSLSHSFSVIGGADTLTSQPILMGGLSIADSVYLSFFYQPGGIGDPPNDRAFNLSNFGVNSGDSLILEIKDVNGKWDKVWAHDGSAMKPFEQVMINIKSQLHFHDGFQFRFRNYASLIGQYGLWHIDYVKLAANRSVNDLVITDVAIQYLPSSILKTYSMMPWNQFQDFQSTERSEEVDIFVQNNFTTVKNTSSQMVAEETVTGTDLYASGVSGQNLDAASSTLLSFASTFAIPDFALDSVVVQTAFITGATSDNNGRNDTIRFDQVFHNRMAYDDGSPEATYRLLGSPAAVAMQYVLNTPDSLQGIEILFAHTEINQLINVFNLVVWRSLEPEDTLLRDEFLLPKYINERNGFAFYRLSRPLLITDTFYIGWLQVGLQTDLKMDVGFDLNTDAHTFLSYNVNDNWTGSTIPGALMIRPVLGASIPYGVGVEPQPESAALELFPNPASEVLYVQGVPQGTRVEIFDLSGRSLLVELYSGSLDIRALAPGIYMLKVFQPDGKAQINKFIKSR